MAHNWGPGTGRTTSTSWRKVRAAVIRRDGNRCTQCGADGRRVRLDVDHIVNVKRGGTDDLENLRALCRTCHQAKTQSEARAGIAAKRSRLRLPDEPHPGLRR
ncbi:HNH endonuclease [Gordonia sp. DT219]|uniref:HNH endonuclease n=1 Tax=Gordonia sp. DT219 TaxID=3416658 RepID=UPI003CE974E1